MKSTLYILDPHPITAEGIKCIAAQDQQLQFIGESVSIQQAQAEIPKLKPDLVLMEVTLKDGSGTEVIKRLRQTIRDQKILIFSSQDENAYGERCLRAGATGYLMKKEKPQKILQAIHQVLSGGFFFSGNLLSNIVSGNGERSGLTAEAGRMLSDRQLQVFELVGRGLDSKEIAGKLELSAKTIDSHKTHIIQKLRLASARELTMEALKWVEK